MEGPRALSDVFNLRRHSILYELPFQSYNQSKNVTVGQSYVDFDSMIGDYIFESE